MIPTPAPLIPDVAGTRRRHHFRAGRRGAIGATITACAKAGAAVSAAALVIAAASTVVRKRTGLVVVMLVSPIQSEPKPEAAPFLLERSSRKNPSL
jgi:hypothetical protein